MTTNKIILGTVQFGLNYGINNQQGKPQEAKVFDMLDYAYNNGIRLLDTADAYGNAVDLIGGYHRKTGKRFEIVTKFKITDKDDFDLNNTIEKTLIRLDINQIWGYLYHSFNDFLNYPEILKNLSLLKQKGLIKNIGLSVYDNEQFAQAIDNEYINLIQLPYNLLDNVQQRGELIKAAKQKGKIIHTRSAFLQGLFFKQIPSFPDKLIPLAANVQKIQMLTRSYQTDMATLALNYVTSNADIDNVLIGVDNLEQLIANMNVVREKHLPNELIKKIDAIKVQNVALLNPSNWN